MSASRLAALLGASAAAILACGGDDPCDSVAGPAVVSSVELTPDDPALALGQTLQLVAVPRSACGNRVDDAQVAWSSSEPDIVPVSPAGMVSGDALGSSVITASSEGVSAQVTVTVSPPQVATVEVAPASATIAVGETIELAATARAANGDVLTGRIITWATGDPAVASVSAAGVVEGEGAGGPVEISATIEGVEGTAEVTVTPEPPPRLVFQVQPEDGTAGAALPEVVVAVVDADGDVITDDSGEPITIALLQNPGAATLAGTLEVDPDEGIARFDDLSLDKAGTGYTLVASRDDASPGESDPFLIRPGAPAVLGFTTDPGDSPAGSDLRPVPAVAVFDAFGNPVPVDGRSVTLSLAANPAGGTLSGTLSANTSAGVASFPDLSINVAGAGYALRAQSAGLSEATGTTFAITPGAAAALRFGQQPANTIAGRVITPAVTVLITDAFGNPTGSGAAQVTLALQGGAGTLDGTTARSAVAGVATFDDLTVDLPGEYTLTAAAPGLGGAESAGFRILAGTPARLAFRVQPSDADAGTGIAPAVEVEILDDGGNPTTDGRTVTITFAANPGGATLGGTTSRNANNGVATYANLTVNRPGNGYRLAASAEGLDGATSDAFDVKVGPVASLEFTTGPSDGTAGQALAPVAVTLRDAGGNVVTGATAPVTIALGTNPTGAPLQGTLSVTPVAGVATFDDLRVDAAATGYRLSAGTAGAEAATSGAFDIEPGTAVKLRFLTPTPDPRDDRDILPPVQVAISDAFNNTVPLDGVLVIMALGQHPLFADLDGDQTRNTSNGVAIFSGLDISPDGGPYTLVASAAGLASAETAPFTVRP
ncbi:MAG TPA: Ig-like domain-containing protein [Gemmatimonadales bacterium]|nr:Ig-like domain-containing protein [Gemmatimonadales bacterium]